MAVVVPPRRSRSLLEYLVRGVVTGLLLAVLVHVVYVLAWGNFRTVLPGEVYRCAQPSGPRLERFVRERGIRTVVNLRGCCPTAPWYLDEARVTSRLGVAQEDISLSATRLPSTVGVRQLVEVIERASYPILFHCHQGADRTGLAAAMVLLLRTDCSLAEALRQLDFSRGHLAFGKTAYIDRFFELYQQWLEEHELAHSSALFRHWVINYYQGEESHATITLVECGSEPRLRVEAGKARLLTARCVNRSLATWQFQPGNNAGVHLWWSVLDQHQKVLHMDRAGLFYARVAPGESIDLLVPLPALPPGRYELRLDLANEQHGFFSQLGNEMGVIELEVS